MQYDLMVPVQKSGCRFIREVIVPLKCVGMKLLNTKIQSSILINESTHILQNELFELIESRPHDRFGKSCPVDKTCPVDTTCHSSEEVLF